MRIDLIRSFEKGADHNYKGKKDEVVAVILNWLDHKLAHPKERLYLAKL
jgi:hypothetical protein